MNPASHDTSRRRFLATTGGMLAATTTLLRAKAVLGANDRIRVGFIGCGGRGTSLMKQFKGLKAANAVAVAVSDPDTAHMDQVAGIFEHKVAKIRDYRKLLDREDIDAVIIASPNYWHALHTIHACQAGKDVYVEKPVSFDVWSGKQMVAAAKRHGRIVLPGTQNRSDKGLISARQYILEGNLGKIRSIYGTCFRNRKSIGKVAMPITPPDSLDYNLWLGPCQNQPIYRPQLHYDWHWDFNTGNGDIGNQGPHELDLISWFLSDPDLPAEMFSFGGRYGWDDAGDTANMQTASFELGGVPCTFEVNNMWMKPDLNRAASYKGIRVGIVVSGEKGEFRGGRGGGYVVGPDGKTKIAKFPGDAGGDHMKNFFDGVRSRRTQDLPTTIDKAHKSAALAHYANVSLRTGREVPLSKVNGVIPQTNVLADVIERQHRQLQAWNINFDNTLCSIGNRVEIDPASGHIQNPGPAAAFNRPSYRKAFEVPEIA